MACVSGSARPRLPPCDSCMDFPGTDIAWHCAFVHLSEHRIFVFAHLRLAGLHCERHAVNRPVDKLPCKISLSAAKPCSPVSGSLLTRQMFCSVLLSYICQEPYKMHHVNCTLPIFAARFCLSLCFSVPQAQWQWHSPLLCDRHQGSEPVRAAEEGR